MSKIKSTRAHVIFKRDFKEYRSGISFEILVAGSVFATFVICLKTLLSGYDMETLKLTVNNILILFALIPPIASIPLFTTAQLSRDKINGTMTNLLATPASPKEIVQGKSRAIFFTGFVIAILAPIIILFVINFAMLIPSKHLLYLPIYILLATFIITPIFCYGLTEFTVQLSMIRSPEFAMSSSYVIGIGLAAGIPICSAMGIFSLSSWDFLLGYGVLAVFVWILTLVISKSLTKEQIVLARK